MLMYHKGNAYNLSYFYDRVIDNCTIYIPTISYVAFSDIDIYLILQNTQLQHSGTHILTSSTYRNS